MPRAGRPQAPTHSPVRIVALHPGAPVVNNDQQWMDTPKHRGEVPQDSGQVQAGGSRRRRSTSAARPPAGHPLAGGWEPIQAQRIRKAHTCR